MKKILSILMVISVFLPSLLWAQRVHIDIEARGFKRMKAAMPAFAGPRELADPLWAQCAKDLEISGAFSLLDPKGYINPGPIGSIEPGTLKDWSLIGADYVIAARAERRGAMVSLMVQVVELSTTRVVLSTAYTTKSETMYRAVHAFMDALMQKSLGLEPIFSSKIVAVQKVGNKKQLYVQWCDGTGGAAIKGGGDLVLNPSWSPDARKIAFVSYWRNNPDLYILDLPTYKVELLSSHKGLNVTPCFDPTGGKIAYTLSKDGDPEIYLSSLSGGEPQRLTKSWATDTSPSISPDGRTLAFCSSRAGTPQIYLMDLGTRKVERLTFQGTYNSEPVFSPKGDMVAFIHLAEDRRFHIALIKTDGTRMKVLPGTGRGDESPTFSPDGRLVAFTSSDGNIYITDFLGVSPVKVTEGGGFTEPCWSRLIE
ncbi:MAG TPA: hypothetical protein PLZ30_08075 [Deltaproteobacteria bacterium]|nr:hypothetical protein [Deltaproteobacteria bacterium]